MGNRYADTPRKQDGSGGSRRGQVFRLLFFGLLVLDVGVCRGKKGADMNICNQLPSTTCAHVSQSNIGRVFGMSNGVVLVVFGVGSERGDWWRGDHENCSGVSGLYFFSCLGMFGGRNIEKCGMGACRLQRDPPEEFAETGAREIHRNRLVDTNEQPRTWLNCFGVVMRRCYAFQVMTHDVIEKPLILLGGSEVERVMGIEPTWPAWKAGALPLSYTRISIMVSVQGRLSMSWFGIGEHPKV